MTDEKHDDVARPSKQRWLIVTVVALAGLAVLVLSVSAFVLLSIMRGENMALKQQLADTRIKADEAEAQELYRNQDKVTKQSRSQRVADQAQDIARSLAALEKEIATWQATVDGLLATDQGKCIAANQDLLQQFHALTLQKRPGPGIAAELQRQLDILSSAIDNAGKSKNPLFEFNDAFLSQVSTLETNVQDALNVYTGHNAQLRAIVGASPNAAPAGTPTLQAAVDQMELAWASERTKREAEELAKVRREAGEKDALQKAESERKIADEERERKRRLDEARAQGITAATDKDVAEIERENQKKKDEERLEKERKEREAQEAQLEREFEQDLPEVRSLLRAFLVEGSTQPGDFSKLQRTTDRGPISLTKLKSTGVLDKNIEAQKKLYFMIGGPGHDRDIGSFPKWMGGAEWFDQNQAKIQKAQELLNKYGGLMVKKKMLAQ